METKDISEEFVQLTKLSITNLLQCLEQSGVKKQFIEDIGPEKYSTIVKDMRNESTIIAMRDFHNWIKLVLISNAVKLLPYKSKISLLDIAVGRGGDLAKWNKSNITYVFGFDKNEKSINNDDPENPGAVERLESFKGSRFKDIKFMTGDVLKPSKTLIESIDTFLSDNKLRGMNIISCQFAMHYFFKSETHLRIVLTIVNKYLTKGGFFIGTTINGDVIKNLFKETREKVYSTELFRIQRNFPKTLKSPFGNEYNFTIFDTKDKANYFNTIGVSTEYLVNFKALTEIAKEYNLAPVNLNLFEDYNQGKEKMFVEIKTNIISFTDILKLGKWSPKTKPLSKEEKELNGLYSTFIFTKI